MKDKEHPMIALFKRFKETVSCNMPNFQHINHADFWAKQARQTHTSELLEDCQTWLSLARENNQKLMQRAEKAEAELAALRERLAQPEPVAWHTPEVAAIGVVEKDRNGVKIVPVNPKNFLFDPNGTSIDD